MNNFIPTEAFLSQLYLTNSKTRMTTFFQYFKDILDLLTVDKQPWIPSHRVRACMAVAEEATTPSPHARLWISIYRATI